MSQEDVFSTQTNVARYYHEKEGHFNSRALFEEPKNKPLLGGITTTTTLHHNSIKKWLRCNFDAFALVMFCIGFP